VTERGPSIRACSGLATHRGCVTRSPGSSGSSPPSIQRCMPSWTLDAHHPRVPVLWQGAHRSGVSSAADRARVQKPEIAAWLRKRWGHVVVNAAAASSIRKEIPQWRFANVPVCTDQAEAKAKTPAESSRRSQPAAASAEALRPTVTAIPPGTVRRRLEDVVVVPTPVTIHEGRQERIEQQMRATLFRATTMRAQPWVTLVSANAYGEPWTEIVRLSSVEVGPYAQYERALTLAWRSPANNGRSIECSPRGSCPGACSLGDSMSSPLEDLPRSETPLRWHSRTFGAVLSPGSRTLLRPGRGRNLD
jgi:hypothetical protein